MRLIRAFLTDHFCDDLITGFNLVICMELKRLQLVHQSRRVRLPGSVLNLIGLIALSLLALPAASVRAEGTAQLGANQDVLDTTVIKVDILTAGEVINISVGNNSTTDTEPVTVTVTDPGGSGVSGSPFSVGPGNPGWLDTPDVIPQAADVTNPLQVTASMVGTYTVEFKNTRASATGNDAVVDPLDITVTPDGSTAVDPAAPVGGLGRVHSTRWILNAHSFADTAATNAAFYVLTATGPDTDYLWKLQFAGLAGNLYQVSGNDVGLPPPNSGVSAHERDTTFPQPQYPVYLAPPEVAKGGNPVPQLMGFSTAGPAPLCVCSVEGLNSTFTFDSSTAGVYEIVIDVDGNGAFEPASGDVLIKGAAQAGTNTVQWDGTTGNGSSLSPGNYDVQLSVRLGEFHFVAHDIETSKPGLRIFGVNPPLPSTTPTSAQMFWDDTDVNTGVPIYDSNGNLQTTLVIDPAYQSNPASTLDIGGLASGNPADAADCGVNAHCWGGFQDALVPVPGSNPPTSEVASPGNFAFIDTYVFFTEAVLATSECVSDPNADDDGDGLTNFQECSGPALTDPNLADTDGDGLSDGAELGGNVQTDPTVADTDGDGIPDGVEDANGNGSVDPGETDPTKADTDDDGLPDGVEDANKNGKMDSGETDPTNPDTDGDGLPDGVEDANANGKVDQGETDPLNPDSDGDGLPDGLEDANHDGVLDEGETDPANPDTDGDGINDGVEDANANGKVDRGETDPTNPDTDGDGLTDGAEDKNHNGSVDKGETDPNKVDTDGDGLSDGLERGVDADGKSIVGASLTDPTKADTDGDGLSDGAEDKNKNGVHDDDETDPTEEDTDRDGLSDGIELGVKSDGKTIKGASKTDPLKKDTDGDGLLDGIEDANHDGVYQKSSETDPNNPDTDDDGLDDGEEDKDHDGSVDASETDPKNPDTDGGGEPDGSEVNITGHNPLDPADDRPPNVALMGGGCNCSVVASGSSTLPFAWAIPGLFLIGAWRVRRRQQQKAAHRRAH